MLKKIVIVGGGAGGLELATSLGKKLGKKNKAQIILIDKNTSHLWKPLLHEVATGSIDESIDSINYLTQAKKNGFYFHLGKLMNLDRKNKKILLDEIKDDNGNILAPKTQIIYDYLIIAIGSTSNDFGTKGVKENCIFLDNIQQARNLHNKLISLFLKNYYSNKQNKIKISIVGAGATGVELSAQIFNITEQLKSYTINNNPINDIIEVNLIEAGNRILPALPERIATSTNGILTKLGIKILTNTMITSADNKGFTTKSGKVINADLMIWSAGIKCYEFLKNIGGLETNHNNQIIVKNTLQSSLDDDIFIIGDCACCAIPSGGFVPPRAQSAHQMADCVKHNIINILNNKNLKPYVYKDHGSLISLSKFGDIGNLTSIFKKDPFIIEGWFAKLCYISLYRLHQIAILGYIKTVLIMLIEVLSKVTRAKIKLH